MRRSLLLALLLALGVPAAFAQGGVNLYWDDCGGTAGPVSSKTFACDTDLGGPFTMILSVLPPAELPQFVGIEAYVDVVVNAPSLPPWWQMDTGQCRAGALSATCDPNAFVATACEPIWGGATPLSVFDLVGAPVGWGFRVRLTGAIAEPIALTAAQADQELVVGAVRITRARTTGADACAGCETGACFVATEARLMQPDGVGDFLLSTPAVSNWVQINGGNGWFNCYVPAANRTWGAIKALYR